MQQQPLAINNNAILLTVTPSNCLYLSCLRKYNELAVHKRYTGLKPQSPALRFSTGLHKALRQIYDPLNGPPPHLDNMGGYIRAAFLSEPYPDPGAREHDVCRAAKILADYVAGDDDCGDAACTIAVERQGTYKVQAKGGLIYELSARLDRALVRPSAPDVLVVRDYKVGRLGLEAAQVATNLAVAKCIWPDFKSYVLEIDGLVDGGEPERLTYYSKECKGIISAVITPRVRRYLSAAEHIAEPGEGCLYCQAKQGCPAHNGPAIDAHTLDFEDE